MVHFLCGIRFPSKLDHYDLWSRPGGPPMITLRFHVFFVSSQLLVRANYLERTLLGCLETMVEHMMIV
jgi:hypothetical protein